MTRAPAIGFLLLLLISVGALIAAVVVLARRHGRGGLAGGLALGLCALIGLGLLLMTGVRSAARERAVAERHARERATLEIEMRRSDQSRDAQRSRSGVQIEESVSSGDGGSPWPFLAPRTTAHRLVTGAGVGLLLVMAWLFLDARRRTRYPVVLRLASAIAFLVICIGLWQIGLSM